MSEAAARVAIVVAVAAGILAGCGGEVDPDAVASEATGVITDLDRDAEGVRSFTLESEGRALEILIAADVDYGFDLAHLDEHAKTGDPVHCRLENREGRLYALSIDDA